MPAPHPRMHGLTHVVGGPDPVPGLLPRTFASYTERVLATTSLWAYWPLSGGDTITDDGKAVDFGPYHVDLDPIDIPGGQYDAPGSLIDLPFAVEFLGPAGTYTITENSFVDIDDALPSETDFTAMAWVNPYGFPEGYDLLPVVGTWETFHTGWAVYVSFDLKIVFGTGDGSTFDNVIGPSIPVNTWSLVAASRSAADGINLYVNGAPVEFDPSGYTLPGGGGGRIRIGAADPASTEPSARYMYGAIDGVALFSAALTPDEIAVIWGGGPDGGGNAGGGPGSVLTLDENGNPAWKPPTVEVEHGDVTLDPAPVTGDASPYAGGPTSSSGWHTDAHTETVVLYDANPARFDVPTKQWVRVPFDTVHVWRQWEPVVAGPDIKQAWLPDDRGLTAQAKGGILHITDAMVDDDVQVWAWFSIEWPVLDYLKLPDDDGPTVHDDAYVRAGRIMDVSHGKVLRASPGSGLRRFFEWVTNQPADGTAEWVDYSSDNPYPIYPVWPARPLHLPEPYPKISEALSGVYYAPRKTFGMTADVAAGDNLCLQVWQDTPWTLRFSTDTFRAGFNTVPAYEHRPFLSVSFNYDPETVDHTTGKLL